MSLSIPIINMFNVDGQTYEMEPVLDPAPTENSENGIESNGMFEDKSDIPVANSRKSFTAGGAWADKAAGAVEGSAKVFTSKEMYKYLRWLLDLLGYTTVPIPESLP